MIIARLVFISIFAMLLAFVVVTEPSMPLAGMAACGILLAVSGGVLYRIVFRIDKR